MRAILETLILCAIFAFIGVLLALGV